jgi:hypothetical protein
MCSRKNFSFTTFLYGFSDHVSLLRTAINETLEELDENSKEEDSLFRVLGHLFAIGFTNDEWKELCLSVEEHLRWTHTELYFDWCQIVEYVHKKFKEFVRRHDPGDIDSLVLLLRTCGLTSKSSLSVWRKEMENTMKLRNRYYPVPVLRKLILSILWSLQPLEEKLVSCTLEDT